MQAGSAKPSDDMKCADLSDLGQAAVRTSVYTQSAGVE